MRMDTVMKQMVHARIAVQAVGQVRKEGEDGVRCDEQIQCEDDADDGGASKDEKDSEERRREAMMMIRRARNRLLVASQTRLR
jgi:hypothetical protein